MQCKVLSSRYKKGLTCALLTCDPNDRMIELRAGRIDAIGPGPLGVPQPNDTFVTAKATFANAGFNQTDMIQAVYVTGIWRYSLILTDISEPVDIP